MATKIEITSIEGEDVFLIARPETPAGVILTRAEVSFASLAVFEVGNPVAVYNKTLDPNSGSPPGTFYDQCMFLTAQEDGWWDQADGYTFWAVLQNSEYALKGGTAYNLEVKLTVGHATTLWPNLDSYGEQLYIWTTTPVAVSSL